MVEHRLAKARAASSNLVSRFASVDFNRGFVLDGFPSGQRGRTVNPLSQTSKVRILPHPLTGCLMQPVFLYFKVLNYFISEKFII